MSPRPDRRPDSRPDRGARRPGGGGPSGRPPSRGPGRPGAPLRAGGNRRPGWGGAEGAGSDRGRPGRDSARPMGEWTPRGRDGDSAGARRGESPRFGDRRPQRPDFGRPEERRPEERRWERRPERGGRFERRPEAGRPPRASGPRPTSRPAGVRSLAPRGAEGYANARFVPGAGARPRPPAELVGLQRRSPAAAGRAREAPEGEHFAGAAPSDLIWGRHSAQAALESGRPIHRIWCTPEMRFSPRFLQLLREAKAGGVLVEEVTWARLGQITGGAVHQGIVLQPAAAETLDLASLIEGCRGTGESPLLIAVDGLTDPQNLGAIVRSAEALGAHGLVLPQRRNAGLTGSVAKVAAGALEHLPVARVVNLNRSLETLKDEGYRVIGLASEGSVTLEEVDLDGPLVVVTGSEGDGLSLLTRRHCDQLVRIPLRGTTPSLNASVATALLLYEIARRGWMQGLRGSSPAPRLVRPALPAPAARDASEAVLEPPALRPALPADEDATAPPPAAAAAAVVDAASTSMRTQAAAPEEAASLLPEPTAAPASTASVAVESAATESGATESGAIESDATESDAIESLDPAWHATIASEPAPEPPPAPAATSWQVAPAPQVEPQPPGPAAAPGAFPGESGSGVDAVPAASGWAASGSQTDAVPAETLPPATPPALEAAAAVQAAESVAAAPRAPEPSSSQPSSEPAPASAPAGPAEAGLLVDGVSGSEPAPWGSFEGDIRL